MYKVKSNLKHNGELYSKGQEVDLKDNEAEQLLSDNVVVKIGDSVENEARETTQPGVNKVNRENESIDGKAKVEKGEGAKSEDKQNEEDKKKVGKYKVLKGLEFPKGKVHKVGDVIELTGEQVGKFQEGLIEEVEDEEENL